MLVPRQLPGYIYHIFVSYYNIAQSLKFPTLFPPKAHTNISHAQKEKHMKAVDGPGTPLLRKRHFTEECGNL